MRHSEDVDAGAEREEAGVRVLVRVVDERRRGGQDGVGHRAVRAAHGDARGEDVRREDERDGDEIERRAGTDEFDDEFQKSFQKSFGASPAGFWRTDVTSHDTTEDLTRGNTDAFNVSARPMSPTVEHAARPATARVNVRGDGAQPGHVFGAAMNAFTAVHTHDAAAHGGRVARGDVDIENVPLARHVTEDLRRGRTSDRKPPTAKITRPKTEYEEKPGKRDPHDVNAAVFEFGGNRTGANVTGTIRRLKSWEKVWQ